MDYRQLNRKEWNRIMTGCRDIFNETKVNLRIKENLYKLSRLLETEGSVMTAEERILILRMSSNYTFAKSKNLLMCQWANVTHLTLRCYNRV